MNARDFRPHDRLYVSNHAYSPKHVNNIALWMAQHHKVELPYGFPALEQNRVANWIMSKFGHDNYLIEQAERIVRSNYAGKQQLFRKGRKVGSRNTSASDGLDDVLGDVSPEATPAAPDTETRTSEAARPASVDLSVYALKTDLHRVSDALTSALKGYCETEFSRVAREVNNINDKLSTIIEHRPTVVTLERRDLPTIELGTQHKNFPRLLKMCNSRGRDGYRLNVWLVGPAGTGKTTAAKFIAQALTPGRFFALPAMESGFQILGYKDASGTYQRTLFREAWEHGGTIIMDESDSYSPSAALAANGALANGVAAFPDGMIPRHPDCIIIAGANTTGLGGTWEYSGRMKLDAAFMNRWVTLEWPIDAALEDAMCANKPWLAIVRHVRAQVIARQIKGAMITPRASVYGEALLAGGLTVEEAMESTMKNGMSDAQWSQVKPSNELLMACV